MPSAAPRKRAAATPINQAVEVAQLREDIAALTKRVEGLERIAQSARRQQAKAVADKLKQNPENLAMLREVLSLAEE